MVDEGYLHHITDAAFKFTEGQLFSWVEFSVKFSSYTISLIMILFLCCLSHIIRDQGLCDWNHLFEMIKSRLLCSVCVCSPAKINIYCFVCLPAIDLSVCPSD